MLMIAVGLMAVAQLPQFSSSSFADWVYTNPATELNQSNILNNRIYLYTTSTGLQLTLTSPEFTCVLGQGIDMRVTWITDQWQSSGFVVSKVALTAALLNEQGVAVDSVTYIPTSVSRTNTVDLSIVVPNGLHAAKLRFASWKADVNSNGAVRQIKITPTLRADVNLDGEVNVADINAIVGVILGKPSEPELIQRADVNDNGEVNIADINRVLDYILG
jgi:hypothetical protein